MNETFNSSLFFWYFPSEGEESEEEDSDLAGRNKPLILWLQGGPGWPTMYGLFKVQKAYFQFGGNKVDRPLIIQENGPYLVGYDESKSSTFLVPNKHRFRIKSKLIKLIKIFELFV